MQTAPLSKGIQLTEKRKLSNFEPELAGDNCWDKRTYR